VFYRIPGAHEGNVYVLLSRKLSHLCRSLAVPFDLERCTVVRNGGRRHAVLLQACKLLVSSDWSWTENVRSRGSYWWMSIGGVRLWGSGWVDGWMPEWVDVWLGESGWMWNLFRECPVEGCFICGKVWLRNVGLRSFWLIEGRQT
jgi:hypothetical protein